MIGCMLEKSVVSPVYRVHDHLLRLSEKLSFYCSTTCQITLATSIGQFSCLPCILDLNHKGPPAADLVMGVRCLALVTKQIAVTEGSN